MPDLKAKDTYWNGLYFRSRLEARWAVFYDRLGIRYEYEPEKYDLGNGVSYIPDFWLPEQQCFIEIKPEEPSLEENRKAYGLCEKSGKKVYIAIGQIHSMDSSPDPTPHTVHSAWIDSEWGMVVGVDWYHYWCLCPTCGRLGIEFNGRGGRICRHDEDDKNYSYWADPIAVAYRIARTIRFEEVYKPEWKTWTDESTGRNYARRIEIHPTKEQK